MEEQVFFKVNQVIDDKDYTAFSSNLFAVIMIRILFGILCANMLILTFGSGIFSHETAVGVLTGVMMLPVVVLLILMIIFYPSIMGKNLYKNYTKMYGMAPIQSEIVFTENYIYDTDPNGYRRFAYYQIEKVVDKPGYCFLMFNKQSGIIIKKNAFTAGDPAALSSFVMNKKFAR